MMVRTQTFKITKMHCTSCAITIDGELEDMDGVVEAKTSYAKQKTDVIFDADKITDTMITDIIKKIGYTAEAVE
jgi:copper chaperone CopZ